MGTFGAKSRSRGVESVGLHIRMCRATVSWICLFTLLTLSCSKAELLNRNRHQRARVQGFNTGGQYAESQHSSSMYNTQGESQNTEASAAGAGAKPNPKTTFLVPRTDKIQIAFTDGGREIQQNLHTDLLKLYKSVMEQLLERDQFIQTVKSFMEKTAILDNLVERVRRLELHVERMSRGQNVEFTSHIGNGRHTGSREGTDPGSSMGHRPDGEKGGRTMEEKVDNVAKKVRRQHEDITKVQEEHETLSKVVAEQALEMQRQRDFTSKLHQTVQKMDLEISRNKQMTIAQAELLDHHANKMETQRSTSEVIDAKVGTVSSKVQWHDFRLGMIENTTSRLDSDYIAMQLSFGEFHTTQRKIYGLVEKLQTDTERCHVNVATAKMKVRFLEQDVDKLLTIVEKLTPANVSYNAGTGKKELSSGPFHNMSLAGSVRIQVQEMIDKSTAPLHQTVGYLNISHLRMEREKARHQNQLDRVTLDIENTSEETRRYFSELRSLANDVDSMKIDLDEWNNEKDRIRRKLNKLEKEVKEHDHGSLVGAVTNGYSQLRTTVGHLRRTTRSLDDITPVASASIMETTPFAQATDANLPDGFLDKILTPDPVKVTTKPFTDNDAEKGTTDERPSPRPDLDRRKPNCSLIKGFGSAKLIRSFPRILTGTWMKDPTKPNDTRIFVLRNNVKVNNIREYRDEHALSLNNLTTVHHMPHRCTGTGHVVYNGHVYCNKFQSNRIMKYNLETGKVKTERLRNAGWNNSFPYSSGAFTDIDLAVDENGLWAIYSTKADAGKLVIAKLNPEDMMVRQTWVTDFMKTEAANAFMSCGRLYATMHKRGTPHEVGYIYDTNVSREIPVKRGEITFGASDVDLQASLDYNPVEKRLYAWILSPNWDGLLVSYDVIFQGQS